MSEPQVTNNEAESRYEIHVDGVRAGLIDYVIEGDTVEITHTEVDDEFGGQGLAGKMTGAALEDLRDRGITKLVPTCPYTAAYLEKHPEYSDLVK